MQRIGLDEKTFAKGQSYVTLLCDLDQSTEEAIADGNETASAVACFSQLSPGQMASVEAVAMAGGADGRIALMCHWLCQC